MTRICNALGHTQGFLVVDAQGRRVGTVECPMYGRSATVPDALAVRCGWFDHHRGLIPADVVESVDDRSRVVGLRVARESIVTFI